jgi:CDP-glucose 4,6-dehydratase
LLIGSLNGAGARLSGTNKIPRPHFAAQLALMLNRSFWKSRRVFLTGHTGFKGSWLSLWLHRLGAEVTGYALAPPTQPSLFDQAGVSVLVKSICGDIRDFQRLKSAIAESRPEVVIHMAAQSVVRRGYADPIETYSSNVMGTVHLLEALRQLGQPGVVVNITSDKCYENKEWVWGYRENDRLGGHDPYSNSKACAELVTSAFCDSYFHSNASGGPRIAIASARAGNVIGGGDWTCDQLIPDLLRSFLDNKPCLIRSPSAIRPWQFVLEPLHGYLLLAERLAEDPCRFGSAWNFGPAETDARPVSWIADRLAQLWSGSASWRNDAAVHPPEAHYLKLDTSKTKAGLGWQPVVPLINALDWIVEWYRAFHTGGDLGRLTRMQIERYEVLLGQRTEYQTGLPAAEQD